jgi:hypothetical protein
MIKRGDELKINSKFYKNREGVVLEVSEHSIDKWIYQVEIKMEHSTFNTLANQN